MNPKTIFNLIVSGQLSLLLRLNPIFRQSYRNSFITAAISEGLYVLLRDRPAALEQIHHKLIGSVPDDQASKEKLKTWLNVGVSLGELQLTSDGYALGSRLSRQLAHPSNDGIAAMFQEVHTLHHELLTQTPARLREKRPFALADTDGELIARSSRILEPYILEIVDAVVPEKGSIHLLEVGCGSGIYIQHACRRNPELRAVGVELQPHVAEYARKNMLTWGLTERVKVECGDIRGYVPSGQFDLITLHNNIYYFPTTERQDLLSRLVGFLNPGGKMLVTTACTGYEATQMLNLWGEMTAYTGPLPQVDALFDLMSQAGLKSLRKTELLPGGGFFAFAGSKA